MNIALRVIIDLFIVGGCFFAFAGAVGIVRMPDTFSRMQSSTNITTLGILLTLIGALLYFIFVMHSWGSAAKVVIIGVLTVLVFALCRQWHIGRLPELAAMLVINGWLLPSADMTLWGVTLPVELLATAALLPIWLYRGRQGPHGPWLRWAWYGFYPAHLLVLWLIDTKTC